MSESEIDTPALLIDLDVFEANLDGMAALLAPTTAKLRAHARTDKSPVNAHLQIARGAAGQCAKKVAEAEALACGGVPDILVSSEVVSKQKLAPLAALARLAQIAVCDDDESQIPVLGEKLRLVPRHCDPTVDRYDWYVGVRGGRAECRWPISARAGFA